MCPSSRARLSACVASLICLGLLGCPGASRNFAPEADDQSVLVPFESATAITLTASDPDSGPQALSYAVASQPQHGTLTGTAPNVTYTPASGFSGTDSFTFTASDGAAVSDAATVTITVQSLDAGLSNGNTNGGGAITKYTGTFQLTWQWERGGGTESAEISGTVEFGNPIDLAQLYADSAPGVAYSVVKEESPALVGSWSATEANGTTCTAAGSADASASWGWLLVRNSPREQAIELTINGSANVTCQPPQGPAYSYDRGLAGSFGGGGCAPVFVARGSDDSKLEGTATFTCSTLAGTVTATLTWNLTGN